MKRARCTIYLDRWVNINGSDLYIQSAVFIEKDNINDCYITFPDGQTERFDSCDITL